MGADGRAVFSQDPVRGIQEIMKYIKYVLRFGAIVSFITFLAGGGMMIFAFGNEEKYEKGKKIITGAGIGIIIILISFALTSTVISGTT